MFVPVAVETAGTWNHLAVNLIQDLGWRISAVTQDTKETGFLLQRLSVRGFTTGKCGLIPQHFHHGINIAVVILLFLTCSACRLCACDLKTNNNNARIMFMVLSSWLGVIARVHAVHAMNAEQRQTAADLWTKPTDLSHRPACRQLGNHIHHRHCYSARKLILILPSHRG